MKRTLIVLCAAFTFGFAGYVTAQSDQYGGQTSSKSNKTHASKQEVTLSGCLEQGSDPNTFVLRNATEENSGGSSMGTSGSSSGSSMGTAGQSGTMQGEQSTPMDFQLVGKNLKKYVGQRVQVRGKIEPMDESGQSGMSTSGTSGSENTQGSSGQGSMSPQSGSMSGQSSAGAMTHRVKVSSVKQLASSCQ